MVIKVTSDQSMYKNIRVYSFIYTVEGTTFLNLVISQPRRVARIAPTEQFDITVRMHQGSVLLPFFSALVVDAVTELPRGGVLSELLYANDLVLMSETVHGLRNKFIKWKEAFESKILKVILGKNQCVGCCCCRPHSTNVLPAESSTRNHVAASSLSPQVARKGSTLSGFVQRSRLEREVGRDLHSNKWEEV